MFVRSGEVHSLNETRSDSSLHQGFREILGFSCKRPETNALCSHQPAGHSVDHDPLWQVHGVGDGQHHQAGVAAAGPVEEVVHDVLLPRPQQVQLQGSKDSVRLLLHGAQKRLSDCFQGKIDVSVHV